MTPPFPTRRSSELVDLFRRDDAALAALPCRAKARQRGHGFAAGVVGAPAVLHFFCEVRQQPELTSLNPSAAELVEPDEGRELQRPDFAVEFRRRRAFGALHAERSEEHTSELQSLMRISYAVFCLKKKKQNKKKKQ